MDGSNKWWVVGMGLLVFLAGVFLGMSANFNARFDIAQSKVRKELNERCCSCTQAELGRCGHNY